MIGRIVRSVDFERVLRCPPRARTAHFALHHLQARPTPPSRPAGKRGSAELSTGEVPVFQAPVDDFLSSGPSDGPTCWLGMVIPKRHARRSVTRSLLKRQIRLLANRHAQSWPAGLWVVRLRAPWDRQAFQSAASAALADAAAEELGALMTPSAFDRAKPRRGA
ncbi:MAG: ribonuclease P protein component [Piscinibacter sp.]